MTGDRAQRLSLMLSLISEIPLVVCGACESFRRAVRRSSTVPTTAKEKAVSILSTRLVADPVARLFAAIVNPAPKPAVRFPEIAGRTTTVSIPTRHGDTTATVYHPAARDSRRPAVYVNIHGGGFVVGHREQDDPWCRYLAAHADVVVVNTDYVLAPHRRFPAPVEQIYDVLQWA